MASSPLASRSASAASDKPKRKWHIFSLANGFDMPFLIILLLILVVGLICQYSASYPYAYYWNDGDSYFYIRKQVMFALLGVAAMLIISTVDYHILHYFAIPAMVISWVLLVIVLFSGSDVRRWIRLPGIQFQPSEIAKFALILLFAHLISLNHKKMKTFTRGYLPFILILGITCGLVVIEPHLSGTMLLLAIGLIMMYVGGTRLVYLLGTMGLGIGAVVYMVVFRGYEQDRINVWLHPFEAYAANRDEAWQTIQSLYAIGSGGLMGQGLGNSRQKHMFLPEPHNDFIFAVVCEEMGFIGAMLVICIFLFFIYRGILIGLRAPDRFSSLLVIGIIMHVGLQMVLNIAVVTNSLPSTGISLPFFSYGGSSLWGFTILLFIFLSIDAKRNMLKA